MAPLEIVNRRELHLSLVRQQVRLYFDVVLAKHFEERPLVLPVAMIESYVKRLRGFCDYPPSPL